ncbi:MAG TPA: AAA family ATPase [Solirubrobacteraceae bacterium]|nr:AAA family ATPase [Solirubrobacteraceae bacterium]
MSIDRLRAHYGFSRMPFGKDLAPQMLHAHRVHEEAVARISWCVDESAIGVVTGECGSGKTVAARAAISALDASRHSVIYLGTPAIGARGTYAAIVTALGGRPRFHCASLIPQCQDLLVVESAERRKRVVLVLDEAHLLDADTLDGLRCLANIDMDSAPLCMLLLGQPTLRRRLRLGSFAALDQRVGLRYHLSGLELAECSSYIAHHLSLAGRKDTLFSDDAVALIHQGSRGLPRAINNLAVQSLIAAFSTKKGVVDESSARAALAEVNAE